MPATNEPFRLEVFFSGLVFFVRRDEMLTHVVLRDGRVHRHDLAHHLSDPEPGSPFAPEDFDHTPLLKVKRGDEDDSKDGDILNVPLKWHRVAFEWKDGAGERVLPEEWKRGAMPFGSPEDIAGGMPNQANRESFYWLSTLNELNVRNRVRSAAYDNGSFKAGILAQVPLQGGALRTSVFAWAEDRDDEGNKVKLIPELEFTATRGKPGPMARAAAEGITWTVEAPAAAEQLVVLREDEFGTTGAPQVVHSFTVAPGKRARVGVTNYPRKRQDVDPRAPHPGRGKGVGSLHFAMLYDLVQGPVSPGDRHVPWIPSDLRARSLPYGADLGNPFKTKVALQGKWDSPAVTLFLKEDRPICVDGSARA